MVARLPENVPVGSFFSEASSKKVITKIYSVGFFTNLMYRYVHRVGNGISFRKNSAE